MKKRYIIIIAIILLIIASTAYYFADYSHADSTALSYINGTQNVSVSETSNGLLLDGPGNDTALIFYPGAKVEYTSYLPLLNEISSKGVDCYLVKMPLNFAFFGADSADEIIENTNYTDYVISGHSLGGVVASSYANNHNLSGLVLLAAYPTDNITVPTLSIYGSNDKVMDLDTYEDSKALFKGNFTEFIIDGGNHGQFANYGIQSGDGITSINSTLQQRETANKIIDFVNSL